MIDDKVGDKNDDLLTFQEKEEVKYNARCAKDDGDAFYWNIYCSDGPSQCWFWNKKWPYRSYNSVWEHVYGKLPHDKRLARTCEDIDCISPYHRKLVSRKDFGENHHCAKLENQDVLNIRRMYDERQLSMNALAKQYNVSKMTISLIVRRETWKHLVPGCEDEIPPRKKRWSGKNQDRRYTLADLSS